MSTPPAESETDIRLSRPVRAIGVVIGLIGILLPLSGFAAGANVGSIVFAGAPGCVFLLTGLSAFRARTWVEENQLVSRFLRTTRIPATEIGSLSVQVHGQGSNLYIRVDRLDRRRPVWPPATGRFDTRRSRKHLELAVQALRAALHLHG
jgi:hypothetical protein